MAAGATLKSFITRKIFLKNFKKSKKTFGEIIIEKESSIFLASQNYFFIIIYFLPLKNSKIQKTICKNLQIKFAFLLANRIFQRQINL